MDKFADWSDCARSDNGLYYINRYTNAMFSCRVVESYDQGSHRLFIAEITESKLFSNDETVTYDYYRSHIKPAPPKLAPAEQATWVCSVCGYVYEGETLPADFICPLCKHPGVLTSSSTRPSPRKSASASCAPSAAMCTTARICRMTSSARCATTRSPISNRLRKFPDIAKNDVTVLVTSFSCFALSACRSRR